MIILRRKGELCVMCMAYLIVLLEQLLRHQWGLMVVFLKCESSPSNSFFSQGCEETFQAVAIP